MISRDQGVSIADEKLNFIISPGRSGTTLLRKHLLENTSIHIPPESSSLIILIAREYINNNKWTDKVKYAIQAFEAIALNDFWNIDLQQLREHLNDFPSSKQSLPSLILAFYKFHGTLYNSSAKVFVDKSPFLSQNLMWLKAIFPNSNYLYLTRNPFEVTFSRMSHFREDIEQASNKWIWSVNEFNRYYNKLNWKLVFYEELIEEFDQKLLEISEFFDANVEVEKKLVDLGEDHLAHHQKLSEVIQRFEGANFSGEQLLYLMNKFSKIKNNQIEYYYFKRDKKI